MSNLFLFIFLVSGIFLVIGIISPKSSLFWDKKNKPTRKRSLLIYGITLVTSFILFGVTSDLSPEDDVSDEKMVTESTSKAENIKKNEKQLEKKLKEEEVKENKQIAQLERELASLKKGIDFSKYRGSIEDLQFEIILFGTWASLIKENEDSDNEEVKKLAKQLKSKVASIQGREFPKLRREYAKFVASKLWVEDIESYASGTTINFSGGVFAANRNKQEFQEGIQELLNMFRFRQARYRWYKGADEYTYYTIYEGRDADPVTFDN